MSRYINILIFLALTYVIIRHFLLKNEEDSGSADLEKIIREKKIKLGSADLKSSEVKEVSELDKVLQWGDQNLGEYMSKKHFNSDLYFELDKEEVILNNLDLEESGELFSYLLDSYLKGKKDLKYKKVSNALFKLSIMLMVGVDDSFFSNFQGQKKAVLEYIYNDFLYVNDFEGTISRVENVMSSVKKFFLLSEVELKNVSNAYSKKELAKMYHPDQMELNLIPEKYREMYFNLYSEQFSKLISHQS